MRYLTNSPAVQSAAQFVFYCLIVACLYFVPTTIIQAILAGLGLA